MVRAFLCGITMLTGMIASSLPANAAIIVFTDRATWEAALTGPFTEETFVDASLDGFSVSFVGAGHSAPGQGVSGGELHDRLDAGGTTEFNFAGDILAFGGNWDLAGPGGAGTGISLFVLGGFVVPQILNSSAGGFFGIISDTPFNQVVLHEGTQPGGAETYDLDNVVFQPAAVPEPASLTLVGMGAFGFVARAIRRRRQST